MKEFIEGAIDLGDDFLLGAMVRNESVDPSAQPRVVARFGAMERWDGQRGTGNLNAHAAMSRAIALSREHGIGCVAMCNTNHWMRGGTYGWQAAEAGMIGICWTNTMPNLPPWGGAERAIGNNPLVIAVPRAKGPVVLDMAMSQFSYGTLESYRKRGEQLPDFAKELTPEAIRRGSLRGLPFDRAGHELERSRLSRLSIFARNELSSEETSTIRRLLCWGQVPTPRQSG